MNRLMGRIHRMRFRTPKNVPTPTDSITTARSKKLDAVGDVEQASPKNTGTPCGQSGYREIPTMEDVMKVRRYDCSMRGHDWDILQATGHEDPVALICRNCDRRVRVME